MLKRIAFAISIAAAFVTPRAAHADFWINLDPKLYIKNKNGSRCEVRRVVGHMEVWSCTGKGSLWLALHDRNKSGDCTLSFWSSGAAETWHADLTDTKRLKCTFKWANNNTIELKAP